MSERIRVFVADDHPLYVEALEDAVRRRPDLEFVGGARDGRTALAEIERIRPAVAVLDVRMGGLDGAEVLNAIVRDELPTRVVLLSSYIDSSLVYDLLAQGASGFLDKGASAEEICDAIVAVARGETMLSPRVEGGVLQQIRLRGGDSGPGLTPRELEVLRLVAAGLSAPAIAAQLMVEPSTVKSHLQNLYEKLGVSDRAAAVAEGMRRGLVE
ncbi:MAG: two-component system, NarL family, nitrate/nitrite response regulator NarL [Thermoleophilaceae bacterium]|nr:two-component system, NarL family, nitrate/nitrite response regulator NarL [Thermoleophilaceae bacterium]